MMSSPISIAYLINSLRSGGAERQLVELVTRLDRKRFTPRVLVWEAENFYEEALLKQQIPVYRLPRRGKFDLGPMELTAKWLRSGEVEIVHGYMDSANLFGALAQWRAGRGVFIASERNQERRLPRLVRLHKPWAHRRSALTIANSEKGQAFVMKLTGLTSQRVLAIPNGLNMERFQKVDAPLKKAFQQEFGWPSDRPILLSVGSLSMPSKNYIGLAEALARTDIPATHYICWIGDQQGDYMQTVHACLQKTHLRERISLLPPIKTIERAYQACDAFVHCAHYEGTPNVVIEAMACECPVLATDTGDTARYVQEGRTGWLIPPGDSAALEAGLRCLSRSKAEEKTRRGVAGRQNLHDLGMDVLTMVRQHETLYEQLAATLQERSR